MKNSRRVNAFTVQNFRVHPRKKVREHRGTALIAPIIAVGTARNVEKEPAGLPEPFIPKMGARIMSLGNPENKMSKSDPDGCVYLMDKPEDILRKFKRAVTDCETAVRYDRENKPGISNLLTIYCAATGKTLAEAEAEFADQGYGVFKPAVGEAVVELLRPIREEAQHLLGDKAYLESIYKSGAERASYLANKTLRKVYKKVGFVAR